MVSHCEKRHQVGGGNRGISVLPARRASWDWRDPSCYEEEMWTSEGLGKGIKTNLVGLIYQHCQSLTTDVIVQRIQTIRTAEAMIDAPTKAGTLVTGHEEKLLKT